MQLMTLWQEQEQFTSLRNCQIRICHSWIVILLCKLFLKIKNKYVTVTLKYGFSPPKFICTSAKNLEKKYKNDLKANSSSRLARLFLHYDQCPNGKQALLLASPVRKINLACYLSIILLAATALKFD